MVIYPGYRTNQKCCDISSHPQPSLAFEALGNLVTLFLPGLISHYSAEASPVHGKTSSLACSSCSPSSRSALLSLHCPALIHDFWPISRLTAPSPPCTSLFLQLKPFDIERKAACFTPCTLLFRKHTASHMAGAGELPGGQNSNVNGQ